MKILGRNMKSQEDNFVQSVENFFSEMPFVLLIKSEKVRCTCYVAKTLEFDKNCPYCLGTGFIPKIERHRTYHKVGSIPETLPRMIRDQPFSSVDIDAQFFYFLPSATPERSELIAVGDFDQKGEPLLQTFRFYKVNYSDKKFDETGRTIYYKVACERDPINSDIKSLLIYKDRGKIEYIPVYR